eukprot:8337138-Pyramimonas_sp.AAC.1
MASRKVAGAPRVFFGHIWGFLGTIARGNVRYSGSYSLSRPLLGGPLRASCGPFGWAFGGTHRWAAGRVGRAPTLSVAARASLAAGP